MRLPRVIKRILIIAACLTALLAGVVIWLWSSPSAFMGAARVAMRWRLGVTEHSTMVDGHRWPWLEAGSVQAPPVILLHGYNTSMDAMMSIMAWIAPTHRAIAPDLPGFGQHEAHPEVAHDGTFYATQVLRFMDTLGIKRATIIGTSMGGAIAAEIAIIAPDRVDRLVLLAPAGLEPPFRNDFMRAVDRGENPLRLESEEDFRRIINLVFYRPPPTPPPVVRHFVNEAQRRLPGTNRIIESLREFVTRGLEDRLGQIEVPTLVLWGSYDLVLDPSLLPRFVTALPRGQGTLIPDAGHVLFHDRPEDVRREIIRFLAQPDEAVRESSRGE
ncbi:MAG: alpha/beta fold hydrolase [Phycisphaeraceae bacterium]|nr:alpha/beta fold hydrolase [Phycisphaeraceae bacterium]